MTAGQGFAPEARLLDLSRLVSRLGQGPLTGIDRVELAYLREMLARDLPFFALVRCAGGFCLLDRDGAAQIRACAEGAPLPDRADLVTRVVWRGTPLRGRAETLARRCAVARCRAPGLARMLRRHLPARTSYLNIGHSNLSDRVFDAVHALGNARAAVLVHDVIPLDHPEYSRPDTVASFARRIDAVARGADLVICNSADTEARARPHFAARGRVPPVVVAHLGLDPLPDAAASLPAAIDPARPVFVVLGTIEPRKNHALLLDVWDELARRHPGAVLPQLVIIGRRGWNNAEVFARLDGTLASGYGSECETEPGPGPASEPGPRLPDGGARGVPGGHARGAAGVIELSGLDDPGRTAVLRVARALLFPSKAEGFGLPLIEAAALGLPVLCGPLAVCREILGEYPVYLRLDDVYSWADAVEALAQPLGNGKTTLKLSCAPPGWAQHFNRVLSII